MSEKIPFRVSARTARLIGQQNFTNAEGAVIELIKNGYDADAKKCVVIFDNKHSALSECKLYILDNGDGMDASIIRNQWMMLGTDDKEKNPGSRNKRVKSGAKGIGRFALDRLGMSAEMMTKPNSKFCVLKGKSSTYFWKINWNDFEDSSKALGDVEAELTEDVQCDFKKELKKRLPLPDNRFVELGLNDFDSGTLIEVIVPRDEWSNNQIEHIYAALQVLIPPKLIDDFDIYLYSTREIHKYGKIIPEVCSDYDYKLEATADSDGHVKIKIFFDEYEKKLLQEDEFFKRPAMQKKEYCKKAFEKGYWEYDFTFQNLLEGYKQVDEKDVLSQIGKFDFTLYFLKQSMAGQTENKFCYKQIHESERKQWLKVFSGIKIFRDNFRVRPYGEKGSSGFDWLDLGGRAAQSPAGVAKKGGGWKVRANNIYGVVNISRLTNLEFEDKSSRDGIQENTTFSVFKELLIQTINKFERYRAHVARELKVYYLEEKKEPGDVLDEEYNSSLKRVDSDVKKMNCTVESVRDIQMDIRVIKKYTQQQAETIEELRDEQKLLRALASGALVTASFAHELNSIEENLGYRIDEATALFKAIVDKTKLSKIEEDFDPFLSMQEIKNEDKKLKEWLKHSLEAIRWDKRRRMDQDFQVYFERFQKNWKVSFDERGIDFAFQILSKIKFKIFEVDLDCIFNNLIINSVEAFRRPDAPYERTIKIELDVKDADVCIKYLDSGPGLLKDIVEPNKIFEPHFTTKRNRDTGGTSGTGLGMWLVKSVVEDNNGDVKLLFSDKGFGISIYFANKLRGK